MKTLLDRAKNEREKDQEEKKQWRKRNERWAERQKGSFYYERREVWVCDNTPERAHMQCI